MQIKSLASGSSGNAYFVGNTKCSLLLECGISFRDLQQRLDFQISSLAGCLISHSHKDHSASARDLVRVGVDIYASQGTVDEESLRGHRVHIIEAKKQFDIGDWTVLPFDTVHDAERPLGFLLVCGNERLLYATDTRYIRYKFRSLTHILIEANYATDLLNQNRKNGTIASQMRNWIIRNHMSLETVKEFLLANDLSLVREIHLLHLSGRNSDAGRFKREIQAITGKEVYIAEKQS